MTDLNGISADWDFVKKTNGSWIMGRRMLDALDLILQRDIQTNVTLSWWNWQHLEGFVVAKASKVVDIVERDFLYVGEDNFKIMWE